MRLHAASTPEPVVQNVGSVTAGRPFEGDRLAIDDPYRCYTAFADPERTGLGKRAGPLAGVRFAAKDNLDTVDLPTSANTPALSGSHRSRDNPVIARLTEAGAVLVGKTNMHELALGVSTTTALFPATLNPAAPDRSAGGSSGGSAAAVASGSVPFALGTDTGGSISIPAAWCGVVGFRPSTGRWPSGGVVPLSHTRDTVGVIARSIDEALGVDAIVSRQAGGHARGPHTTSRVRVGIPAPESIAVQELAEDVRSAWNRSVATLRNSSAVEIIELQTDPLSRCEASCGAIIERFEISHDLGDYLALLESPVNMEEVLEAVTADNVRAVLMESLAFRTYSDDYDAALGRRGELRALYEGVLREQRVAGILYPTTPMSAPRLDQTGGLYDLMESQLFERATHNVNPGSVAGQPTVTFPAISESGSLPVGLSLDGHRGRDRELLGTAQRVANTLRTE